MSKKTILRNAYLLSYWSVDPVLVRITQEIFMELSKNPGSMGPLQQRLIPTLVSILQAQPLKVPLSLQAVSFPQFTSSSFAIFINHA